MALASQSPCKLYTEVPPVFRLPRGGVYANRFSFFLMSIKLIIQKPYWRFIAQRRVLPFLFIVHFDIVKAHDRFSVARS